MDILVLDSLALMGLGGIAMLLWNARRLWTSAGWHGSQPVNNLRPLLCFWFALVIVIGMLSGFSAVAA